MYCIHIVAFSLLAIVIAANGFRRHERWAWWALLVGNVIAWPAVVIYDVAAHAIGPFELLEYVGLAIILGSLAVTGRLTAPDTAREACSNPNGRGGEDE
jgi:hypothetical protein